MEAIIIHFREAVPGNPRHSYKKVPFLPTGSTVVVLRGDGGPWTQRMILGHETDDYNGRSYHIRVAKLGCAITRIKRHMQPTNISEEDNLQIKN